MASGRRTLGDRQPGSNPVPTYDAHEHACIEMADCARGSAVIPGVQYETTINRWHTCQKQRTGSTRQQPLQRVHVPRRHGLQPGQHQPNEDGPPGRHDEGCRSRRSKRSCKAACRSSSSLRKSWSITPATQRPVDRREQPHVPPARPWAIPTWAACSCRSGIALRLRRRPRHLRMRYDCHAARLQALPHQRARWPVRSVRLQGLYRRERASRCFEVMQDAPRCGRRAIDEACALSI